MKKKSLSFFSVERWQIFSSVNFFLFLLMTCLVVLGLVRPLDFHLTQIVQAAIPASWDEVLSLFSLMSNAEVMGVICLLLWIGTANSRVFLGIFSALGVAHLVEFAAKALIFHPAPPPQLGRTQLHLQLPSHFLSMFSAYPSGHSMRCVFFGVLICYWFGKQQKCFLQFLGQVCTVLWVFGTLITRVSLGEHWLSDVVGGTFLGAAVAGATILLLNTPRLATALPRQRT